MLDKNKKFMGDLKADSSFALGRQLTIEYYECGEKTLLKKEGVENALLSAARESGATIINSSFHEFDPQGISGVVIIAESHFTVHAWPEYDYAAVDIFTCGDNIDLETAINSMKDSFQAGNVVISSDQNRGIISKPFEQERVGEIIKNSKIHPISWRKEYDQKKPWGVQACIDVYSCDPATIRDAKKIEQFVYELCDLIKIKPYGECQVVHFGEDEQIEGFSMTQLIGTALISGHFTASTNAVYLDVFCCKFYEPREVAEFATSFFKGENFKMQIASRQ